MKKLKTPLIYLAIILVIVIAITGLEKGNSADSKKIEYTDFVAMVKRGEVAMVEITERELVGLKKNSEIDTELFPSRYDFYCYIPSEESFRNAMNAVAAELTGKDVNSITEADYSFQYTYNPPPEASLFQIILPYLLILGAFAIFYYFVFRSQGGGNQMMSFGKSRARTHIDPHNKVTFADVEGADEEKEELKEVVEFMRAPKRFTEMGARIPKGVLLVGPPGTGKTLLAKAVAGEAQVPFFSISGSDFVEMFVGVGASRVRDLFEQAKRNSPSIVFIDEIDAVGRHRGAGLGGGHDEREQTLNQLLVEMDGFAANEGVIVMAATNRRDILDPALLRPGRFDRQITVNYPDVDGRVEILKVHSRGKPLAADVDLENIAKRTPFATGADLENIMNEAAIRAARARKTQIDQSMLIEAVERVQMGPEKKSHKVLEEDRKLVAYHEAGHAIVGHFLPLCDEVHTVTIVPRGGAGGFTLSLPSKELDNMSRNQLLQRTSMMLGGHAAERLIFHDVYTGAQSDLQHATSTCRAMVTRFGMSDKIGTIYLDSDQEVFVGASFGHSREYSEELAAKVDAEVSELLKSCYQTAMDTLTQHQDKLNGLAELLIERETLSRGEFVAFMEGRPLPEKSKGEPAQEQTQQAETAEPAAAENTPNE